MSDFINLDTFYPQTQEELDMAKASLNDELLKCGLSGILSKDKVWRKYYSDELLNVSLPKMCMADYLYERNKNRHNLYASTMRKALINHEEVERDLRKIGVRYL